LLVGKPIGDSRSVDYQVIPPDNRLNGYLRFARGNMLPEARFQMGIFTKGIVFAF
jgi:hypothetical protein